MFCSYSLRVPQCVTSLGRRNSSHGVPRTLSAAKRSRIGGKSHSRSRNRPRVLTRKLTLRSPELSLQMSVAPRHVLVSGFRSRSSARRSVRRVTGRGSRERKKGACAGTGAAGPARTAASNAPHR